jgi:hypothetical protein
VVERQVIALAQHHLPEVPLQPHGLLVEAAGIEPGSEPLKPPEDKDSEE